MGSFSTQRFEWWDLPLWRKAVIVGAAILFFVSGSMPFDKESNIYVSAPGQPNTATRQIYPVHVNHGYLRYGEIPQRSQKKQRTVLTMNQDF